MSGHKNNYVNLNYKSKMSTILDSNIVSDFREFMSEHNLKTLEEAQTKLIEHRNKLIGEYSLVESRSLWASLLIYRFKSDMEASDELWNSARSFILSVLKKDNEVSQNAEAYLNDFSHWKKHDYMNFVAEIASLYYNVVQIRLGIENKEGEDASGEWKADYNNLIDKIHDACNKLGCLKQLHEVVHTMEEKKHSLVAEIMNRAYWDKMEEDIGNSEFEIVYRNLEEIKTLMKDMIPKSKEKEIKELDEYIDVDFVKHKVEHGGFDQEYLLNLFTWIINFLREWDASHFQKNYSEEILNVRKQLSESNSFPNQIRIVFEKSMTLVLNLKSRKGLWEKILFENN